MTVAGEVAEGLGGEEHKREGEGERMVYISIEIARERGRFMTKEGEEIERGGRGAREERERESSRVQRLACSSRRTATNNISPIVLVFNNVPVVEYFRANDSSEFRYPRRLVCDAGPIRP